jgi:hypothetical protein
MSYNPNFAGTASAASSKAINANELNNTGNTINKLTPVRINSNGDIDTISPSIEDQVLAIAGIVNIDITTGTYGDIVNSGRIENITTSAIFGDVVYLSSAGGITTTKPSAGIDGFASGDFSVKLGVVAKNRTNPLNKDLVIHILIGGQL